MCFVVYNEVENENDCVDESDEEFGFVLSYGVSVLREGDLDDEFGVEIFRKGIRLVDDFEF